MVVETQIEELSREELIAVIDELIKENRMLATEIVRLKLQMSEVETNRQRRPRIRRSLHLEIIRHRKRSVREARRKAPSLGMKNKNAS